MKVGDLKESDDFGNMDCGGADNRTTMSFRICINFYYDLTTTTSEANKGYTNNNVDTYMHCGRQKLYPSTQEHSGARPKPMGYSMAKVHNLFSLPPNILHSKFIYQFIGFLVKQNNSLFYKFSSHNTLFNFKLLSKHFML